MYNHIVNYPKLKACHTIHLELLAGCLYAKDVQCIYVLTECLRFTCHKGNKGKIQSTVIVSHDYAKTVLDNEIYI